MQLAPSYDLPLTQFSINSEPTPKKKKKKFLNEII